MLAFLGSYKLKARRGRDTLTVYLIFFVLL